MIIDPGEATLLVLGLKPIVSKEVERVYVSQFDEIDNLGTYIEQQARRVTDPEAEFNCPDVEAVNYKSFLNQLVEPWDREQLETMIRAFGPRGATEGQALLKKAPGVVQMLKAQIPRSIYSDFTGFLTLEPSNQKMFEYLSMVDILNGKDYIWELIGSGGLLKYQAMAFKTVYPSVSEAISEALVTAMVKRKSEKKSYQLPLKTEYSYRIWFNKPHGDLALLLQANFQAANEKAKGNSPPPKANPTATLTNTQRTSLKTPVGP